MNLNKNRWLTLSRSKNPFMSPSKNNFRRRARSDRHFIILGQVDFCFLRFLFSIMDDLALESRFLLSAVLEGVLNKLLKLIKAFIPYLLLKAISICQICHKSFKSNHLILIWARPKTEIDQTDRKMVVNCKTVTCVTNELVIIYSWVNAIDIYVKNQVSFNRFILSGSFTNIKSFQNGLDLNSIGTSLLR